MGKSNRGLQRRVRGSNVDVILRGRSRRCCSLLHSLDDGRLIIERETSGDVVWLLLPSAVSDRYICESWINSGGEVFY